MNFEEKKQKHLEVLSSHLSEEVLESLIEYVSLCIIERQFSLNLEDYEEQSNIVVDKTYKKDNTIAFDAKDERSVA